MHADLVSMDAGGDWFMQNKGARSGQQRAEGLIREVRKHSEDNSKQLPWGYQDTGMDIFMKSAC